MNETTESQSPKESELEVRNVVVLETMCDWAELRKFSVSVGVGLEGYDMAERLAKLPDRLICTEERWEVDRSFPLDKLRCKSLRFPVSNVSKRKASRRDWAIRVIRETIEIR